MSRNEYRRSFIMLRAVQQGYGGHVRLEKRTLTGNMYFVVTAPQDAGALTAALAGQRDGEYHVQPVGSLSRDRRGQLTLAWQFDPRDIGGRPLEAYAWVVVATASPCGAALVGNLEGSRSMDLAALNRAVCAGLARESAPAADLPAPEELLPQAGGEATAPATGAEAEPQPAPEVGTDEPSGEQMRGDVRIYTRSRLRTRTARHRVPEPARPAEAAPSGQEGASLPPSGGTGDASAPCDVPTAEPEAAAPQQAGETAAGQTGAPARPTQTAATQLGLDITRPWPGAAEALRRLFATQVPADTALGDGFVYVSAPQPGGGQCYLAGLKAQEGRPTALRYAVPGRQSPEPPAGLEAYRFIGDGPEGHWVMDATV